MSAPTRTEDGLPIERLPWLGRSWYKRGPSYWLRRVTAVLLFAVGLAVAGLWAYGFGSYIVTDRGLPVGVRVMILVVVAGAIVYSGFKAWQGFREGERLRRAGRRPTQRRLGTGAGATGMSTGASVRRGSAVTSAFLVIGSVFFLGWFVVLVLWSLQPEYGIEHQARQALEQLRAERR